MISVFDILLFEQVQFESQPTFICSNAGDISECKAPIILFDTTDLYTKEH